MRSFVNLGGRLLASWLVTQEGATAAALLRFYKEIAAATKLLKARFSREYLCKVKRKSPYWNTIHSVFPPTFYRSFFVAKSRSKVFKRLRTYLVQKDAIDFFIRLAPTYF